MAWPVGTELEWGEAEGRSPVAGIGLRVCGPDRGAVIEREDRREDCERPLIATGVAMAILFQVFINVGVNIRLLPVTGVPLPFISYGGSSLVSTLLALGLVQSVSMRRPRPHRFESV